MRHVTSFFVKKVQKSLLVSRWDSLNNGSTSDKKLSKSGVDGYSLSGKVLFNINNTATSSMSMKAFKGAHDKQLTGKSIDYSSDANPEILLGEEKTKRILKLLQNKKVSFTYDNFGQQQYIYFTYPFGYSKDQTRTYEVIIRDMSENKDIKKTIIFSPAPVQTEYSMENEVTSISLEEMISLTGQKDMFSKGMIQIKDITNDSEVQLGKNKIASSIPTLIRYFQSKDGEAILNSTYVPTNK